MSQGSWEGRLRRQRDGTPSRVGNDASQQQSSRRSRSRSVTLSQGLAVLGTPLPDREPPTLAADTEPPSIPAHVAEVQQVEVSPPQAADTETSTLVLETQQAEVSLSSGHNEEVSV